MFQKLYCSNRYTKFHHNGKKLGIRIDLFEKISRALNYLLFSKRYKVNNKIFELNF